MAERDSWAVGASGDRRVGAEDARLGVGALLTQGNSNINTRVGLRPGPQNPGLVAATGTPGPTVTVNSFQAALTLAGRPGTYIATLDDTKTLDVLTTDPADPSNDRWDLIIAQQRDADYGDADRDFEVIRVTGTPDATPEDPTVTGGDTYIPLARIRVTAGAATITNAMIDDLRPGWVVALGAILPIPNSTARTALTGTRYDGFTIYRQDRDWIEVYDGTAFRVQGIAVCSSTSDRDTAITNPVNGQYAVTTDTNTLWVRAGGSWVPAASTGIGGGPTAYGTADVTVNNSATLVNATGLVVALDANAKYVMDGALAYTTPATPDIKYAFSATGSPTGWWGLYPITAGSTGMIGDLVAFRDTSLTTAQSAGGSDTLSGNGLCLPHGYIATTTAATLQLQVAQNTATAVNTIAREGSWLRFRRVA